MAHRRVVHWWRLKTDERRDSSRECVKLGLWHVHLAMLSNSAV